MEFIIEVLGWLSAAAFALCMLPQAVMCMRQGHAEGVSRAMLWMWLFGEVGMIAYTLITTGTSMLPLLANYACNIAIGLITLKYAYLPRMCKHISSNDMITT